MPDKSDGNDEKVLVGILDLAEAKRLRSELSSKGIELEIVSNPETCSSGKCSTKVELYSKAEDLPNLQEFIRAERARMLEGLDVNPELADQVYDPEKGVATCPACGTEFSTDRAECPECGLGFSTGESG